MTGRWWPQHIRVREGLAWGAIILLLIAFAVVLLVEPSAVGRGGR